MKSDQLEQFIQIPDINLSVKELNDKKKSIISILKAGIGTGLLVTPYVFEQCGILLAPLLLGFCAFLCYKAYNMTIDVLDNTDNKNENMTLYESSKILLGADKTKILEIVNVLYNFGTSTNYILLIMKNMMIAFSISESYTSKIMFSFILGVIYIPLSRYRNLAYITKYSSIAVLTQIAVFSAISFNGLTFVLDSGIPSSVGQGMFNIPAIPFMFGLIFFMYDMSNVYSDIRNSMQDKKESKSVLKYYFIIVYIISVVMGGSTYLAFGDKTKDIALENIKDGGIFKHFSLIISSIYVCCLIISLTIFNFTIFTILEKVIGIKENQEKEQLYLRIAVYIAECFVAILVPSIIVLINIQGAVWVVIILFVFPYLCLQQLYFVNDHLKDKKRQHTIILQVGLIAGISGLFSELIG